MDITTEENRTARLAVTDAFFGIGYLVGLPLGTRLKQYFGYNVLFTVTLVLSLAAILYAVVFVKDSYHLLTEEKRKGFDEDRKSNVIRCEKGNIIK